MVVLSGMSRRAGVPKSKFLMEPDDHKKSAAKYEALKDPNELGVMGWVGAMYYTLGYVVMNYSFIKFPYHTHGAWPLPASFLLLISMLGVDFAVSKTPMRNVERLLANGYSPLVQVGSFVWVWVVAHFGSWLFLNMFCTEMLKDGDWYDWLGAAPVADAPWEAWGLRSALIVCVLFTAADCGFMPMHEYILHKGAPWIHHMHHVCVTSSIHSAYCFHALDIVLEFATPVSVATLTHLFITQDPVAYYVFVSASVWWYFMGHDETMKMPHWRHHKYRIQDYSAYWFALFNNH